jgi:hypothetical protein
MAGFCRKGSTLLGVACDSVPRTDKLCAEVACTVASAHNVIAENQHDMRAMC